MAKMTVLDYIAIALLIAGGLNWILFPFGINLVAQFARLIGINLIATIIYELVGASAIYSLYSWAKGRLG